MMTEFAVAHHEAAHAVAGYSLGFPASYVSIRGREDSLGRCRTDPNAEVRPGRELDFAVILVAGTQAERFALGREPWYRVNWFRDDPGSDEDRAREWIGSEAARGDWDELEGRALVQLKGRGLVFTQWRVIEALAQTLQRDTTVLGAEIERTCRELGAKQYGTKTADFRTPLAELEQQIAALKAQLDQAGDDNPSLWPKRRELVGLYNKQRQLLDQLEGGTHR
jgi:uncharacterized small protein (DUF1192 family)